MQWYYYFDISNVDEDHQKYANDYHYDETEIMAMDWAIILTLLVQQMIHWWLIHAEMINSLIFILTEEGEWKLLFTPLWLPKSFQIVERHQNNGMQSGHRPIPIGICFDQTSQLLFAAFEKFEIILKGQQEISSRMLLL